MCIDYRLLNNTTMIDWYLIYRVDDIFDHLGISVTFISIDL